MFNSRDTLFGQKNEIGAKDNKASVLSQRTPPSSVRAESAPPPVLPVETPAIVPATAAAPSGSKLIVGPDIKLKGVEITDCDTLVVEGRVEATMDSRVMQIAEHGVYSGTVGIDVAEIHGRFEGELTARKHLVIHATGRVSGTIRYGKLTVEDGGEISGNISTLSGDVAAQNATGPHVDIMTPYDPFANKSKPGAKATGAPH